MAVPDFQTLMLPVLKLASDDQVHATNETIKELAAEFHGLWNKGKDDASLRFIVAAEPDRTLARLALVQAVAFVVASGLAVMGVEPVQEMR